MCIPWLCFLAFFKNLTFEECVAANDCSINSDEGEGFLFAKKILAASLNCLNKAIAIISVQILQYFSGVLMNGCITTWKVGVFISFEEAKVSTGQ